jgi:hypothetical protein
MIRWLMWIAAIVITSSMDVTGSEGLESPRANQGVELRASTNANSVQAGIQDSVVLPDASFSTDAHDGLTNNRDPSSLKEAGDTIAREDLEAQKSMAWSSTWMLYVACVQLVGSFGGILILIWTLRSTREATRAAAISAEAAKQAVLSERACMSIENIEETRGADQIRSRIVWINSGRAAAIIKSISVTYQVAAWGDPVPDFRIPTGGPDNMKLGPGQKAQCETTNIPFDVVELLFSKNSVIYLFTRLEYRDTGEEGTKFEEATIRIARNTDWSGFQSYKARKHTVDIFVRECVSWGSSDLNGPIGRGEE